MSQRFVTEKEQYVRDLSNMALINRDVEAFRLYKAQREEAKKAKQIYNDVEQLKSDIAEIKNMLLSLSRG